MQCVVTGQAPITLERKIASGGKHIKTKDNTHNNWNKSYTSDKNKKQRSAYQDTYISYASRVAAETETEVTAKYPQEKDRMKTNDVQIEIEKKEEDKKKTKKVNISKARKTARKGDTHTSGSQGARGGCTAETR